MKNKIINVIIKSGIKEFINPINPNIEDFKTWSLLSIVGIIRIITLLTFPISLIIWSIMRAKSIIKYRNS